MSLFSNNPRRQDTNPLTAKQPETSSLEDLRIKELSSQNPASIRRSILVGAQPDSIVPPDVKAQSSAASKLEPQTPLTATPFPTSAPSIITNAAQDPRSPQGSAHALPRQVAPLPHTELGRDMRKVTKQGVEIVTHFESFMKNAYKCPGGTWTIGYGHTSGVKEGDKLPDHKTGVRLLKDDLRDAANVVRKNFARIPMTQAQFDALTSLAFNCPSALKQGDSRFAKHVTLAIPKINTERDPDKKLAMEKRLISHLCRYSNADGEFLDGLLRRRLSEGLRLVGAKDPVVSIQEYKALRENARVHLGKPHAKTDELAPLMVSYMLKHRLGEGKAHKAHQHEHKDARRAGDNRR